MELIVDANVIFACLIKDSHTRRLFLTNNFILYAPEYLYDEVRKHIGYISETTGLSEATIESLLLELLTTARVRFVPHISPDPDDVQYIALALKLNIPIWSNDKELKHGQKQVKVYSTADLAGF